MNKENIKWLEKIIKNSCYNKDDNKNAQEILNFYNNEKDRWVLLPDDNDIVDVEKSKNNNYLNLSKEEKQEIIDLLIERSLRYINKGFSEDEEKYFKNLIENIWFLCQEYNKKMPYSKKTILAVICGIEVENILTKVR